MKQVNVQDRMLNTLRREKIPVTITIVNGYQIRNAFVSEFDNFVIVVMVDGEQRMVYKHAISTITPSKAVTKQMISSENELEEE